MGLSKPSNDPSMGAAMLLTTNHSLFERLAGGAPSYSGVLIRTDGTDPIAIKDGVGAALKATGISPTEVLTADERIIADVASMSGGEDELTMVLLVFALVAFVVTGLVVMNTFSVLIAQRTRELALLRTLGAVRAQIRRSVLLEALVIGLLASTLGVLLATGVMAALIGILAANVDGASFAVLSVSPMSVIVGIGAGTLMTLIAAWVPARHAMGVAPLAALRPADDATLKNKAGLVRIILGFVLLLLGGGLLAMGAFTNNLVIAFGGGLLSFPGVLLLASLFLPKSVSAVGALFRGTGVPARLASLNAVRNPGRTTATATALLIGVTLVSMMMVGAQTAKVSLNGTLAENYLVDLTVTDYDPQNPFTQADAGKARSIEGVQDVAVLNPVALSGGGQTVYATDAADLRSVLNDVSRIPGPGEVLAAQGNPGTTMKVYVQGNKQVTDLKMILSEATSVAPVMSTETAATLPAADPSAEAQAAMDGSFLWIKVAPGTSSAQVQAISKDLSKELNVQDYQVGGSVLERQMFSQVIDMMLMIVSGLLAVAVFIALIGVANTLSLSVLERTRENSLLRALGLTRGQLRGMLALEAVLIGGVAALLGVILGSLYGALGAQSALGEFSGVIVSLPWLQLASVIGISVLAALIASVAPARRAARLSPVEGLAAE
ncbi:ABC transporter permease [Paeniglutamicibacter cryotolerans]|uniref:ABC transporter permease n=1 Tax=Paeniglutamicibacter cryotolerans TaxID=670079 RepID=UPI001609D416|nr:FtsX-like permease family protein [Paeniglutamicibacter cryotolerans]